jgi:hypothetical protein
MISYCKSRRFFFIFACLGVVYGQNGFSLPPSVTANKPSVAGTISLTVDSGTPLQVVLDREVRIKRTGQPIQGRLAQPIYAFDRVVIPAGTAVNGQISKISSVSGKQRTLGILNADFTPTRQIEVEFNELVLADGRHIRVHTVVTPGSGQVIRLVGAGEHDKKNPVKDAASQKMAEAKRQWQNAMKQVQQPDKMHRLMRFGLTQLPARPQYIDAGTVYFAELQEPLDFGSEPLTSKTTSAIGTEPPPGSLAHALLVTPLDSGTTQKGADVEAMLSQPLFDQDHLILPQGSRLKGSVLQVRPARSWHRNGQLRITFRELVLPDGAVQRVDTNLEGIQSGEADHAKLDTEGGAQASSSKMRYVSTGVSVSLAIVGSGGRRDVGNAGPAAGGATSLKLIGIVIGLAVRSHSLAIVMSAYGGIRSIYSNFLGRGRNIVFPKNTSMDIGFGDRTEAPMPVAP